MGEEEIAAAFFVSVAVVKQRLRLAAVTRAGLTTNLVINTDRRTYHLELRSSSSSRPATARLNVD